MARERGVVWKIEKRESLSTTRVSSAILCGAPDAIELRGRVERRPADRRCPPFESPSSSLWPAPNPVDVRITAGEPGDPRMKLPVGDYPEFRVGAGL
jgi:hypothetical protein